MPSSNFERATVCGTVSGKLYLITPRFNTKTIDSKELKGKHPHEIKQIVINNHLQMFISVDAKNKAVLWTAFGVKSESLNVSMLSTCALCHRKPKPLCVSCNRAVCNNCILTNMCKTCYSMSLIYILFNIFMLLIKIVKDFSFEKNIHINVTKISFFFQQQVCVLSLKTFYKS